MALSRRLVMASGALVCALGLGYIQQRSDAAPADASTAIVSVAAAAPSQPAPLPAAKMGGVAGSSAHARPTPDRVAAPLPVPQPPESAMRVRSRCAVSASATVLPAALVRLTVDAPCHPWQSVTIHHGGMIVTELTDRFGVLEQDIPALSDNALFMIDFPDGAGTVALANVPGLHRIDRFVLQWAGTGAFQVHARGPVDPDRGVSPVRSELERVDGAEAGADSPGTLVRLGDRRADEPRLAEIHSFPAHGQRHRLDVEAEVTPANCGREVAAQTIEWRPDTGVRSRDLVFAMPGCAAVGQFLVLNNPADDLMIASR